MLIWGQEVTRVYTRIAYEFKLLNQVSGLQRKQTRSTVDFRKGKPILGPFIPHKREWGLHEPWTR